MYTWTNVSVFFRDDPGSASTNNLHSVIYHIGFHNCITYAIDITPFPDIIAFNSARTNSCIVKAQYQGSHRPGVEIYHLFQSVEASQLRANQSCSQYDSET